MEEAETFNKRLGRNLIALREVESMSQQELADAMRLRGFRWAQSTVWNIERGERPLKFEEAVALGVIFSVAVDALSGPKDQLATELEWSAKSGAFYRAIGDLRNAAREYERSAEELTGYLVQMNISKQYGVMKLVRRSSARVALDGYDRLHPWRPRYGLELDDDDPARDRGEDDGQH